MNLFPIVIAFLFIVILGNFVFWASRYKRCPSDKVLFVFGKTDSNRFLRCIHNDSIFVWPLIQDFKYLDITPFTLNIDVRDDQLAFTVGVSTNLEILQIRAKELLQLNRKEIMQMAKRIIRTEIQMRNISKKENIDSTKPDSFIDTINSSISAKLEQAGLLLKNINLKQSPLAIG